ncbi:MAG TPA: hypothetical protein VIP46_02805 [Pyrinomonadaceae bacterium]
MAINNTDLADRQRQPVQLTPELRNSHEDWRAACAELTTERERLDTMRAALDAQAALVSRLASRERSLRTRLNMQIALGRLPFPSAQQPAVERTGVCHPVEILGWEDDDGGRYVLRADGSYPDCYRIRDKRLNSFAFVGSDEATARTRLADLRAAETPACRPMPSLLSSLARRAYRVVTG